MVMSGVVTVVTLPLVAYYFNQLSWLGLFTNVAAVPVMGVLLVPIGLGAGIWQIVVGGTMLPLASMNQWLLEHFVAAVRLVMAMPLTMPTVRIKPHHSPVPSVCVAAIHAPMTVTMYCAGM